MLATKLGDSHATNQGSNQSFGVWMELYCFNSIPTFRYIVPVANWRQKEGGNVVEKKKKIRQLYT